MSSSTFRFPVYQIDFSAVAAGKRVAATKRRIRWRFGFPNRQALEEGRSGTDCRGEEHDVIIIWSVTSGKRQILMDGKEIHYSATRTGIIDHSWSSKGNHVMKVVCHAAPPMTANPGFRQYDLFIDGQSFFNMPKVYELGIRGTGDRMPGRNDYAEYSSPRSVTSPGTSITVPTTHEEEEAELQRAINASIEESRRHLQHHGVENGSGPPAITAAASGGEKDLFDFGPPQQAPSNDGQSVMSYMSAPTQSGFPASSPPQPQPFYSPPPSQPYSGAPPPPQPYPGAPPPPQQPYPGAPPPQAVPPPPAYPALPSSQPVGSPPPVQPTASFGSPPPAYYGGGDASLIPPAGAATSPPYYANEFAPAMHGADDPFAPKPPTHNDIASEILKSYSASPPPPPGQPMYENGETALALTLTATPTTNGTHQLTMNGGFIEPEKEEDENLSELEKAMRKLVNVDHIDEPAEEKLKLTMKQQEDKTAQKNKNKSKPIPPAAKGMVGTSATLSQISEVKPKATLKEGIMNAPPQPWHAEAAAAGMLVVHGLQQQQQGAPPLQPRGFGVVHGQQAYYGYASPPPQQYPGYPSYR